MSGIQYRRARAYKQRSRDLVMYFVTLKVITTGEHLTYEVLAFSEPVANSKAIEKAENEGYKSITLELISIK